MTNGVSNRARPGWRSRVLGVGPMLLLAGCDTQVTGDRQAASPDTRPYCCNAVGDGTPPGGRGDAGHGGHGL